MALTINNLPTELFLHAAHLAGLPAVIVQGKPVCRLWCARITQMYDTQLFKRRIFIQLLEKEQEENSSSTYQYLSKVTKAFNTVTNISLPVDLGPSGWGLAFQLSGYNKIFENAKQVQHLEIHDLRLINSFVRYNVDVSTYSNWFSLKVKKHQPLDPSHLVKISRLGVQLEQLDLDIESIDEALLPEEVTKFVEACPRLHTVNVTLRRSPSSHTLNILAAFTDKLITLQFLPLEDDKQFIEEFIALRQQCPNLNVRNSVSAPLVQLH